jgi:hypothetical protein
VFFHSANESGPWSDAAAERIAMFSMATFEKNMAHGSGSGASTEVTGPAACQQIKRINSSVATVYYLNSVIDWPFFSLHEKMLSNPSWRLKDHLGTDMLVVGQWGFNFSVAACREAWMADCVAATAAGCDGCFIDRSNDMYQLNSTKPGMMSPSDADRFEHAHLATLTELNARLKALGKFAINNNEANTSLGVTTMMIEDFAASAHCLETLQTAVARGITVQAHAGNYPDEGIDVSVVDQRATATSTASSGGVDNCAAGITNSLAAFLVAAGEYSYFHCASGWQSEAAWPAAHDAWLAWRDEYNRPLGAPHGPAKRTGDVWTRLFGNGTRVVFDGKSGNGTIAWADGTVQTGQPWQPKAGDDGCKWQTI